MKKFRFSLDSLLRLRENQRDLRRMTLAEALRHAATLDDRRRTIEADRSHQMDELRELGTPGEVDVDASATRRLYAGQLSGDLGSLEREQHLAARQIALCRTALIEADQAVKSLEKLARRRREEFEFEHQRRETIETEEAWRALHHADGALK